MQGLQIDDSLGRIDWQESWNEPSGSFLHKVIGIQQNRCLPAGWLYAPNGNPPCSIGKIFIPDEGCGHGRIPEGFGWVLMISRPLEKRENGCGMRSGKKT